MLVSLLFGLSSLLSTPEIAKGQAEAAQKAVELRAQEIRRELENTTKVFELHMEELCAKQGEILKHM